MKYGILEGMNENNIRQHFTSGGNKKCHPTTKTSEFYKIAKGKELGNFNFVSIVHIKEIRHF